MLCVLDYIDALQWVEDIGGLQKTVQRADANAAVLEEFVDNNDWIHFLAESKEIRSTTSVCLTIDLAADKVKEMISLLAENEAAYDIGAYRDAPAGLRIWCGATVDTADLKALMPWIEWAYKQVS
jgi:phosphoserine aminotransferase